MRWGTTKWGRNKQKVFPVLGEALGEARGVGRNRGIASVCRQQHRRRERKKKRSGLQEFRSAGEDTRDETRTEIQDRADQVGNSKDSLQSSPRNAPLGGGFSRESDHANIPRFREQHCGQNWEAVK